MPGRLAHERHRLHEPTVLLFDADNLAEPHFVAVEIGQPPVVLRWNQFGLAALAVASAGAFRGRPAGLGFQQTAQSCRHAIR